MADTLRMPVNTETAATADSAPALGYLIVAGLPALFWTFVAAWIAGALGYEMSVTMQASVALCVAAFLTVVFAALTMSPRADGHR